jgi:hypothetical protein
MEAAELRNEEPRTQKEFARLEWLLEIFLALGEQHDHNHGGGDDDDDRRCGDDDDDSGSGGGAHPPYTP